MNDEVNGNLTKDLLFTILIGVVAIIMIILPYINDPGKKSEEIAKPPGKIMVEVFWNDDVSIDIDGWVQGPKDLKPVGFQNKDGQQFELLRDDLGTTNDVSGRNFENFYSRGIFPGEYIVNIHWYGGNTDINDINIMALDVTVVVTVYDTKNKKQHQILRRIVPIKYHQDRNVFVFQLKADGTLIEDSVYYDNRIILKSGFGLDENYPAFVPQTQEDAP